MTLDLRVWEVVGYLNGWVCPLCKRWWPLDQSGECRAHCKSFTAVSGSRPILRHRESDRVVQPVPGSKPID